VSVRGDSSTAGKEIPMPAATSAAKPVFSVVVPTRSRPDQIDHCLGALIKLASSPTHEIIVVRDGGSNDADSVETRRHNDVNLITVRQPHAGPAAARNRGASLARGRFLAFVDDDCRPREDWLLSLETELLRNPRGVIGGRTINGLDRNLFSEASQLLVSYAVKTTTMQDGEYRFFPSCNLGVDRRVFDQVGGFDTRFKAAAAEDRDFCARCVSSGRNLHFAGDAVVFHHHRLTLTGYLRQHFNYGRGAALFRRLCGDGELEMARTAAPWWYVRLILSPFGRYSVHRSIGLAALLGLAQVATAAGAVAGWSHRTVAEDESPGRQP
jgi:GT2 family glycosyltransferase